mmetsp:Transcript_1192/g.3105  ORF Transcript_1192/g.3105 Transcript_1192/m.3105 type:complete len:302 (+) Transcript_1192:848-1753(+)
MVHGLVVEVLGGDHGLDHVLEELSADLVVAEGGAVGLAVDGLGVLGRDKEGRHALGDGDAVNLLVLDGDLGLAIRAEPLEGAVVAALAQAGSQLGGEEVRQRVELLSLVGGIAEHETLVTGTEVLLGLAKVHALGNIRGLLLNGDEHVAGLVVETLGGVVEADHLDGFTDDSLVVDRGLGGDLTEDHDHPGLGGGLAGDLRVRILLEARVQDGIGDNVAELVRVALGHRFRREVVGLRRGHTWLFCQHVEGGLFIEAGEWSRDASGRMQVSPVTHAPFCSSLPPLLPPRAHTAARPTPVAD